MQEKQQTNKRKTLILIILLLAVIAALVVYIVVSRRPANTETPDAPQSIDANQTQYVKPEEPVDRSKNITLPGWGGFTIPANTTTITQGFEFHNPEQNYWYEDHISINGVELEKLVVDSGTQTELDHYLKLAGIDDAAESVDDYDKDCFSVAQNDDGAYALEGIGGFEGEKTITVTTTAGEEVTLTVTCQPECYYMTFGLYLEDGDELLYQSDLVSPGMYIQTMELSRPLDPGEYDAYVVCQPYQADQTTKTNSGVVKLTLTVK